ncbi:aspartate/glutamate racemase family protein [bacterium]|nr:aspartate/glutamate racemase family protein [bacterium]
MKTIGLVGGVSWESSAEYYRIINREIGRRLGGLASGRIVLYSFNFAEIEPMQREGRETEVTAALVNACRTCQLGGADFVLICSNTTNKNADEVAAQIDIPLVHIADVTGEAIRARGMKTVALLGTKYTMEQDFYRGRLERKYGLSVLVPDEADRKLVNRVIYEELCRGVVREESRREYQRIIGSLGERGAMGVILGCTEIPMLIKAEHSPIPVFDTTEIHALKAVELALA